MQAFPASESKKGLYAISITPHTYWYFPRFVGLGLSSARARLPWFSRDCLEPSPLAIPVLCYTFRIPSSYFPSSYFPSSYFLSLVGGTSRRWCQTSLTLSISRCRWHLSASVDSSRVISSNSLHQHLVHARTRIAQPEFVI